MVNTYYKKNRKHNNKQKETLEVFITHSTCICVLFDSRDERRWIEKQNRAMRQKRKKEEGTRMRNLVDNAYACDPRIKKFKDEEKERKLAEKKAKKEAARLAAEEKERQRLEALENERKRIEKEEQEAKEQAKAAKAEKARIKNLMKKESETIATLIKDYDYFVVNEDDRVREMEALDRYLQRSSLESLQYFREGLEKADSKEAAKILFAKEMDEMREKIRQDAIAETQRASKKKDDEEITDDWTAEQSQLLIKAVNLFPAGTASRWKVIADYVNMHSKTGTLRDSKHVIKKVKTLKKLDPSQKQEVNRNAFSKFDKGVTQSKSPSTSSTQSDPTVRYNGTNSQLASEKQWTSEEQRVSNKIDA
ncbi:PREDICTED: dnaJ homolog subfamily C member 2-like [Acropora digitifera]|uniref:dnaJ homolog subfamily C member 2-like n=1 Tax=Acropora digitifera TaxID=70779 RepID=UPI00077AE24D|nr:PREDICTED: dnaJ homolog subfamily C member 2-like [Acropora digitifera]